MCYIHLIIKDDLKPIMSTLDVSPQTQNQKGTTVKDAWMTISRTASLHYVNFYQYTLDLLFSNERTM